MVIIGEVTQQIKLQRQALSQAQRRAQQIQTTVPVTRAQLQRATPMSQIRRKQQERSRALEKARAVKALKQQEQEFEKAVSPVEAQIEAIKSSPQRYVQQTGMKGQPLFGRVAKGEGYPHEVMGYKYVTPYGTYTDWSPMQKAYAREGRYYGKVVAPGQEAQLERLGTELRRITEAAGGFAMPEFKTQAAEAFIEKYGELPPGYSYQEQVTDIPQEVVPGVTVPGRVIQPPPPVMMKAPTGLQKWKQEAQRLLFGAKHRVGEVYVEPAREIETKISGRLREVPGVERIYEVSPEFGEVAGITAPSFIQPGVSYGPLKTRQEREFQAGLTTGAVRGPIEKPIQFTALTIAGYGATKILPGAIAATGPAAPYIGKGLAYGLPTLYTGAKGVQLYTAPDWRERGGIVGEALTTEVLPVYLGAKLAEYDKILLRKFLKSQKEILADTQAKVGRKKAKGKKATKSETKQIKRTTKLVDDLEKTIKTGTKEEVVKLARNVFENINKADISSDTKIEYVNMYLRLLESYGVSFESIVRTPQINPTLKKLKVTIQESTLVKKPGVIIPKKVPIEPDVITTIPSAYEGTGLYERYAPSELLYPPLIRREEEALGTTNIFEGVAPAGKIEVEKFGQIPPMGILGSRLGVIEEITPAEGLKVGVETRTKIESRLRVEERARQRKRQRAGQVQWLGLSTAQISRQRLREKQRYEEPRPTPRPRPPKLRPPRVPPPIIPWWLPEEEKRRRRLRRPRRRDPLGFGYRVEVRKKGKFVPVVPFAVVKGAGFFLGKRETKRGAAATFRLIPTKEKPRKIGVPRITERALAIEFRKPKRGEDPLTFVQRRRYRIKTLGERREITMKGWATRKKSKERWL